MSEPTAVVILIDNSLYSINSDFIPTRLEAQKLTVERYSQYLLDRNPESQIAIGTFAGREVGIRLSFTNNIQRILDCMRFITSDGKTSLLKGIRTSVLALKHCNDEIKNRRVLTFIHSPYEISSEFVDKTIHTKAKLSSKIHFDFVVFGQTISSNDLLKKLATKTGSEFLELKECKTILSDSVLASKIGPGPDVLKIPVNAIFANDPALAEIIKLSIQDKVETNEDANNPPAIEELAPKEKKTPKRRAVSQRRKNTKRKEQKK
ncbi:26S proteasome non-ATPase regulatory subunit 4 [Histomonas meleagridis]|uniref:26S proteasome non-ATPase regulatory subunit 4 n=1 Tax=Histomonas meleagridis TaxID=135588 RepID=UPI003559592E|nr:26S proteasome non-ATPase regulatory subunit 4 [Histomonas meleagridis]KAH0796797.1 26S proteasome non-ATPase regulatory subunit 4 [Histomonas meleagridis]